MVTESSTIATVKMTGYISAIAIFEYLGIPESQIYILGVLMIIDTITGVAKQFVINRSGITSHLAWIGILKKIVTMIAVFTLALMFIGIGISGTFYIKGALSILIMAETYSVIQNVYAVRTGKILPEFDVVSMLLKSFGDMIKMRIESTIKQQEKFNDKK